MVSLFIGFSCACFAALADVDLGGGALVFFASSLAMYARLQLARLHFNPIVNFFLVAFLATTISIQGLLHHLSDTPKIVMGSSVLLLVPGFPLINGISDMVKGYINTGIARLSFAVLLAASASAGIMLAMRIWNVWGWI